MAGVRASLPPLTASRTVDKVLDTLLLPLQDGSLRVLQSGVKGDGVLFLRAREGAALREANVPGLVCEQSFKPDADALERAGIPLRKQPAAEDDVRRFSLVLVLPPRQRDEARALLARAVRSVAPGGVVLVAIANDEGARSGEADLARLVGPVSTLTKHKCRAFWSAPIGVAPGAAMDGGVAQVDDALVTQWLALDALRPVGDGHYVSRPGLFAWDRIDPATELLAAHVPADSGGRVADLGAGHGMLSALLLARCRRIKGIDLFEAEQRALDAARINLAAWDVQGRPSSAAGAEEAAEGAHEEPAVEPSDGRVRIGYHWHDVTTGVPGWFDMVVSNPPFHHVGRAALPEVGRRFILAAAAALRPGGTFWMVANRNLPYEAVLTERFGNVRVVVEAQGYKVIEAVRTVQRASR